MTQHPACVKSSPFDTLMSQAGELKQINARDVRLKNTEIFLGDLKRWRRGFQPIKGTTWRMKTTIVRKSKHTEASPASQLWVLLNQRKLCLKPKLERMTWIVAVDRAIWIMLDVEHLGAAQITEEDQGIWKSVSKNHRTGMGYIVSRRYNRWCL